MCNKNRNVKCMQIFTDVASWVTRGLSCQLMFFVPLLVTPNTCMWMCVSLWNINKGLTLRYVEYVRHSMPTTSTTTLWKQYRLTKKQGVLKVVCFVFLACYPVWQKIFIGLRETYLSDVIVPVWCEVRLFNDNHVTKLFSYPLHLYRLEWTF